MNCVNFKLFAIEKNVCTPYISNLTTHLDFFANDTRAADVRWIATRLIKPSNPFLLARYNRFEEPSNETSAKLPGFSERAVNVTTPQLKYIRVTTSAKLH